MGIFEYIKSLAAVRAVAEIAAITFVSAAVLFVLPAVLYILMLIYLILTM